MGSDREEILELAHLVDPDLTTRGLAFPLARLAFVHAGLGERLRLEEPEVRMVALLEPETGRALAAGQIAARRSFAKQALGKERGERRLAEPGPAVDEERVGQVRASRLELSPRQA